eukprot:23692-Chlamydomonas_euryale.AAC.3
MRQIHTHPASRPPSPRSHILHVVLADSLQLSRATLLHRRPGRACGSRRSEAAQPMGSLRNHTTDAPLGGLHRMHELHSAIAGFRAAAVTSMRRTSCAQACTHLSFFQGKAATLFKRYWRQHVQHADQIIPCHTMAMQTAKCHTMAMQTARCVVEGQKAGTDALGVDGVFACAPALVCAGTHTLARPPVDACSNMHEV